MSGFSTAPYQRCILSFSEDSFIKLICAFITGKILNILNHFEHTPSALQNDIKGMANFVSMSVLSTVLTISKNLYLITQLQAQFPNAR